MLNLILSGILDLIDESIQVLFGLFSGIFDFSLQKFSQMFPVAYTLYGMIRAVGLGLIIAIAIFQLFKYFVGPLARVTEKPQMILLRAFFAIFLVFTAPYVLEQIFTFTGWIVYDFANVDAETGEISALFSAATTENGILVSLGTDLLNWATGLGAAGVLFGIVLGIVLIVQFTKMMLEIVERYLMTILLIYSSPLAMSTFTSESTSQILKKWASMFVAQCILLLLSVWGCVLFMNVLAVTSFYDSEGVQLGNPILSILYAYGIVKIVKRMDNYLQQVGLNAAGMGGMSLLDSIMATAGGIKMMSGGKSGSGGKGGAFSSAFNLKQHSGLYQGLTSVVANRGNGSSAAMNFMAGSMKAKSMTAAGTVQHARTQAQAFKKAYETSRADGGTKTDSVVAGATAVNESKPTLYTSFAEANQAQETVKLNNIMQGVHDKRQKLDADEGLGLGQKLINDDKNELANDIGSAYRVSAGMDANAVAASDFNKSVAEAVKDRQDVAFYAMKNIADEGGGSFSGEAAIETFKSYAGEQAWAEALPENASIREWKDAKLDMVQDEGSGRGFNFSGSYINQKGEARKIEMSNLNGALKPKADKGGNPIPNGTEVSNNNRIRYRSAPVVPIDKKGKKQ